VVELRNAVGFGPDTDLASILKCVVVPFDGLLPIERDSEMIAAKVDTQPVPLARLDLQFGPLLLCALAIDGIINGHVVFECVGARDVVVVRIFHSPDHAAGLIFLAADWFAFYLYE